MDALAANPNAPTLLDTANRVVKWSGFASRGKSVPMQERVNLTSQMAMMVGAGVSLSSALKSITRQCQRPALREALEQIQEDVLGGSSLSASMRNHPRLFDPAYVATIAAGEASGRMQEVLTQLAELQRSDLRLYRTIRGMLVYPVLLTTVSMLVISTLVVFVLPRFATIFEQYELALPMITRLLIGAADEARSRWWLWAPVLGAAVAGVVAARTTTKGRELVDTTLLRVPTLRQVTQTLIGARACRLLGLLISSGVPLLEALRLLRLAISNTVFHRLVDDLEEAVSNGRSLSEALEGNVALPPSASELIATAEKTGRLGEVSQMMGAHYEEEGQALARQLVSVIEPIVTMVMGAVVAAVVLAVMLPVFDIATLAQRG
ncbi:putative type II secretion system protein F [Botrimarina colliarenosi]|uniref:Putative type II secretion system protein F n=1 Tax=Botrimarina colliarenosi TaxID=2528001 RepID=A0A5C6AF81_9BACT|nr:type II secretion system F family protein [Botrimarina colliarenosi]TWT98086.1 putative type II secretion system protein F [Botrimarina colliarenosi]